MFQQPPQPFMMLLPYSFQKQILARCFLLFIPVFCFLMTVYPFTVSLHHFPIQVPVIGTHAYYNEMLLISLTGC